MSPLERVREFVIPDSLLSPTLAALADAGRHGHEAFAVWGATVSSDGTQATFRTVLVPEQTPQTTAGGLLVAVDGVALFNINKRLYGSGQILAGQVHTHPTDAYHSDTDDHFPLVTLKGALSLVIPDFAADGYDSIKRWAWYRLLSHGHWVALGPADRIVLDKTA
jgi:hypothetical protein